MNWRLKRWRTALALRLAPWLVSSSGTNYSMVYSWHLHGPGVTITGAAPPETRP